MNGSDVLKMEELQRMTMSSVAGFEPQNLNP
jgi:hypothetical protein